jgi:hypothetical protein
MPNDAAKTEDTKPDANTSQANQPVPAAALPAAVHMLPPEVFNSAFHVGVSATFTASGKAVSIIAPDISREGFKIYTTGPVRITSNAVLAFLKARGTELPDNIKQRLETADASIELSAFYYERKTDVIDCSKEPSKEDEKIAGYFKDTLKLPAPAAGELTKWKADHKTDEANKYRYEREAPFLVMFKVSFPKGAISTLTGDPSIQELFDVTDLHVRVLRCPQDKQDDLQQYVRLVSAA